MKRRACLIFTAWAALAYSPAQVDADTSHLWLNAGFYSAHFDTEKGLRNANPGLGFEYRMNDDWSATAGRFINSDNANASYVGAYYQRWCHPSKTDSAAR